MCLCSFFLLCFWCGCQTYFQLVCDYKSVSGESWCVQTLNGVTPALSTPQKGVEDRSRRGSGCHTHTDMYDAYLRDTFQYKYKQWAGNVGPNTFSKHYTHRAVCVCVCAKCACNCKFNELFTFLCACWPRPRPLVLAMLFTWISQCFIFFFYSFCSAVSLLISFIIRVQN